MSNNIKQAISDLKQGNFIIIVDGKDRENEGDLVIAAEKATPEKLNFIITHAKGLVCMPMLPERLDELNIPLMTEENTEVTKCQFTISVDHKHVETGISAFDRSLTIQKLIDNISKPNDFLKPGHMFPLRYKEGGLLKRAGHTEAAIDIVKKAGLYPAAVICEIIKDDGKMARMNDLEEFSRNHNINLIKISDLIKYIKEN